MRIGNLTFATGDRPSIGWSPPAPAPRVTAKATLGGGRVSAVAGGLVDEPVMLTWEWLKETWTQSRTGNDGVVDIPMITGQRLAMINRNGGDNEWCAAVSLPLKKTGSPTGFLMVELWDDMDATPSLLQSVGRIDASDLGNDYADIVAWGETSWNLDTASGAYGIVLNGDDFTGTVYWRGRSAANHMLYVNDAATPTGWSTVSGTEMYYVTYSSTLLTKLRGLWLANGGGTSYQVDLDDGKLYDGVIAGLQYEYDAKPLAITDTGLVRDVKLTLLLTGEAAS